MSKFDQPGTVTISNAKVATIDRRGEKMLWIKFASSSEPNRIFKCWADTKFPTALAVGAVAELRVEIKPSSQNPEVLENWIIGFGGEAIRAKGNAQGAKRPFTPKSPEEIHAAPIASIIAAGLTTGMDNRQIEMALELYHTHIKRLRPLP